MKHKDTDILDQTLKREIPFSVPEGYFDALRDNILQQKIKMSIWKRMTPYAAVAAVFIFLVSIGTFILENATPQEGMTQEDYIVFSENVMNTLEYELLPEAQMAEADIMDEDIINYLIYSGITAEEIELINK